MPQNFIESRRKHGCACWRVETSTCSAATPAASLDQVHRPGAQAAARWPVDPVAGGMSPWSPSGSCSEGSISSPGDRVVRECAQRGAAHARGARARRFGIRPAHAAGDRPRRRPRPSQLRSALHGSQRACALPSRWSTWGARPRRRDLPAAGFPAHRSLSRGERAAHAAERGPARDAGCARLRYSEGVVGRGCGGRSKNSSQAKLMPRNISTETARASVSSGFRFIPRS
jgi:hypothetical protein